MAPMLAYSSLPAVDPPLLDQLLVEAFDAGLGAEASSALLVVGPCSLEAVGVVRECRHSECVTKLRFAADHAPPALAVGAAGARKIARAGAVAFEIPLFADERAAAAFEVTLFPHALAQPPVVFAKNGAGDDNDEEDGSDGNTRNASGAPLGHGGKVE
ncbi:hypothetical protein CC85DRAFT_138274 [Cutaneotrichosporon oleaginosum]|uniref:Uncharacterized protein n=1 Tax=Cutaneotrichosporon oleaginosum TaxID=879819 RepID=A0A0J0XIL1_9TREE|nr:uncharacterized protein CC85DRAFT_138274 [Cutaneotrichosporon oleaginosum]KLT40925.1 hypothetical protein CC85DRAFT_138274 [Cutaneotrichosporon oleaginosum]TXT15418.1 hypothetical protein COLE_01611 [Cutaneotrichosporon oleaginosum]